MERPRDTRFFTDLLQIDTIGLGDGFDEKEFCFKYSNILISKEVIMEAILPILKVAIKFRDG